MVRCMMRGFRLRIRCTPWRKRGGAALSRIRGWWRRISIRLRGNCASCGAVWQRGRWMSNRSGRRGKSSAGFGMRRGVSLNSTIRTTPTSAGGCLCPTVNWTVRWLGMAIDPPVLVLPWLQLLHALSFGATHLGALMFLAHQAPAGQAATAQGYLAIAAGAAMAVAMGVSGVLFADFGSRAYAAMALAAFAGGACGLVAHRLWRQPTR